MTHHFVRDPSKLTEGIDQQLQDQLTLYKTPATIRELKIIPITLSIIPPRRPLMIRPNKTIPYITPDIIGTTNKVYKYFEAPALVNYPRGTTLSSDIGGNPLPPVQSGNTGQSSLNVQASRFPYKANTWNSWQYATNPNAAMPQQYDNPPDGPNPNPSRAYEGTIRPDDATISNYSGKFLPVQFNYKPPDPYPAISNWADTGTPNPFGYATGFTYNSSDLTTQVEQSAYTLIPDLIGTEAKIDLTPFMSMLTDVRVSSDKIAYKISLSSVQVASDGRVLSSARLISNGAKKMDKYLKNKVNPEVDSTGLTEEKLFCTAGFGYPDMFIPRPIIAQSIHVGIKEFATPNKPYQFISNSNQGYSLDKSSGSIIEFGSFPYSELTIEYGHYLKEPVGDKDAIENECNRAGFFDLNNEWFAENSYGGTQNPVLKNQQIERLELRFEISIISLF